MYKHFFKRFFDFWIAFIVVVCLSPVLIIVTIWLHFANKGAGAYFFQERPGKDGKIFKIIKFFQFGGFGGEIGSTIADSDAFYYLDALNQTFLSTLDYHLVQTKVY